MNRPVTVLLLCLASLSTLPALAQPAPTLARYVVLGGQGPVARVVISPGQACPSIDLGGAALAMTERQIPAAQAAAFPVKVCEALIPPAATSARLGGQPLPLPPHKPR